MSQVKQIKYQNQKLTYNKAGLFSFSFKSHEYTFKQTATRLIFALFDTCFSIRHQMCTNPPLEYFPHIFSTVCVYYIQHFKTSEPFKEKKIQVFVTRFTSSETNEPLAEHNSLKNMHCCFGSFIAATKSHINCILVLMLHKWELMGEKNQAGMEVKKGRTSMK